ncbi:MAG: archaeal flagellar protein FlaI [Thermoplasmata archaeon]|jgi:flagellar protein FlaI|nr:archaeal flagellar protein FlaI [Thermoplasmata archaeon]
MSPEAQPRPPATKPKPRNPAITTGQRPGAGQANGAAPKAPPPGAKGQRAPAPAAVKALPPGTRTAAFTARPAASLSAEPQLAARAPNFPPAIGDRPAPMAREEQRRMRIVQDEQQRRMKLLGKTPPDERGQLVRDWAGEDRLFYAYDADDVEVEAYPIREPFAYVQILRNRRTHELSYHVIEPRLSHAERRLLDFIESTMVDVLELQPSDMGLLDLDKYILEKFNQVLADYGVQLGKTQGEAEESRDRLLYYVLRDFTGEGPIDVLMRDPLIEDISCDGPNQPIFVYHRKHEALTTTVRFRNEDQLDSFVIRMAQRAGKHISIAEPLLDATMRDGSRLQASLAHEVSSFGSNFTIRKFKEVPFTPIDLVRFGTMSPQMLAYLWLIVQYHMSAMFAGGTASGKTTSVNAIMLFIPPQNKVVSIEDTREIRIAQPNWIAGVTRNGFGPRDPTGRQAGEIDMFQLLKNALRQRPEYIIVGEVRGEEAYSLFQAMATGHAAYGTMHADSVDAVIHRLESEPLNIPRPLLEALDVVTVQIQTRVGGKRVRRTKQITEIVGLDPNTREILTNEVFRWVPGTDSFEYSGVSYALERIAAEAGMTTPQVVAELQDRVRLIQHLVSTGVRDYESIAQTIISYYKDKPKVMSQVGGAPPA